MRERTSRIKKDRSAFRQTFPFLMKEGDRGRLEALPVPLVSDLNHYRNRLFLFLAVLLAVQLAGCTAQMAHRRAQAAATHGEWDRAVGQYMVALNEKPDNPQYRAGFERARLAASQFHFQKAKELVATKNYEQAIIEFHIALNFDPSNQFIANEMDKARINLEREVNKEQLTAIEKAKEEAKKKMQLYKVLGPEAETMIPSLRFRDDSLKHILDSLGMLAGINIVYDSDFRDQEFSVSQDNIKFSESLNQILVANKLYYKPLDQSTILVIPDNPQKRRQYDEQVIQTFYLSNSELNDVLNMVRSVMQIQRIATNPQLNAITVRDTPDKIAIVQKIIEANDKAQSEVLLDVEILEVNRDQALRYGIDLAAYSVTQELVVGGTSTGSTVGSIFGHQLKAIDAASWRFTVPSVAYTALSTDQHTKLLAKPQIRASEGKQVTVRLGDRVPIPVTVFQAQAVGQPTGVTVPTTTFQQQDVGINIDVTPRVHHNREITLTMRFELTSITAPGVGTLPPTIGNRTVNTVIRLKDGETNLLAGLLRRDERRSLRGIPGILKIPFIRELFAANEKGFQEKDIVFTITPHILRTPNITEQDLAPIWIGTEDDIRLKSAPPISVFQKTERKSEKSLEESLQDGIEEPEQEEVLEEEMPAEEEGKAEEPEKEAPAPPSKEEVKPGVDEGVKPAPAPEKEVVEEEAEEEEEEQPEAALAQQIPEPAPPKAAVVPRVAPQLEAPAAELQSGAATFSFDSPNVNPQTDTDIIVHVQLESAFGAATVSLFLNFDPAALQVKEVLQGALMTPGSFAKSFDNGRGSVNMNAHHTPGDMTSGVVASVVFHALKSGKTTLNLNSAVVRDSGGKVIPVTFLPYTIAVE